MEYAKFYYLSIFLMPISKFDYILFFCLQLQEKITDTKRSFHTLYFFQN